ncbi:Semaphorin-6A [Liparis tanakae]|uniref:Semaphorin-6A n=1 Tax=Liparis tanakae TaxID=230148 RepID=A0A4Z2G967_9TELE|nr:Semaphorin-6A [Liparis tanakae]
MEVITQGAPFKLTQIAVDTSAGPYKNYTVVFLGSDNGRVLKILASTEGANASFSTQLLEDVDVYNADSLLLLLAFFFF